MYVEIFRFSPAKMYQL